MIFDFYCLEIFFKIILVGQWFKYQLFWLLASKSLELIVSLAMIDREGHVDAAEDIVRVSLAVEESLGLVVTLEIIQLIFRPLSIAM